MLTLLQNDPELPQTATDMKKRYKYDRATETAKAKSNGKKLQLMGNAGGGHATGANGLDASQRAPAMLAAFAKAVKTANQRAFSELWWLLKQAMSAFSEQELGKNGRQLRDLSVEDFFARVFDLVMMQVMVPGQHRDDDKHCDGGASLLHLALSLRGRRGLRLWEIDREQPYEFTLDEGDVYLSSPACFSHQPLHRDKSADASSLRAFEGLDERMCKWAILIRCALFVEDRATCPPASPIRPFQRAAEVVAQ